MAIGGDDTLSVASRLFSEKGLPTVGVPKTIDNDLASTDFTFGFDTAINIVTEAVDRLRTTAESHRRIIVVETMGRHAGWIACFAGIALHRASRAGRSCWWMTDWRRARRCSPRCARCGSNRPPG